MGPHLMTRPPKFVQGFIDRHGKARFYFRRAGFKQMPLPGLPWSPEFMAAYEEALGGQPVQVGSAGVRPGTIRSRCVLFRVARLSLAAAPIPIRLSVSNRELLPED